MKPKASTARGFTLIEVMVVAALIGILSSIAIPEFQRLTIRAKTAEREEIMLRIKKAVADYYSQHGNTVGSDGDQLDTSGAKQPSTVPGVGKLMPNFRVAGEDWRDIFRTGEEIEGALYYQYWFTCAEPTDGSAVTLTIGVVGDLDGDTNQYTKQITYTRRDGAYIVNDPANDIKEELKDIF